jgi:hypothetical protein
MNWDFHVAPFFSKRLKYLSSGRHLPCKVNTFIVCYIFFGGRYSKFMGGVHWNWLQESGYCIIAEALMSSPWEFAVVTSVSIFVPFFLSLFPPVLAYCYDQQLISNLAFCPSLFSISSSMRRSVHEQSCVVPIMFNAWVGGLVDFFGGSIYDLFYMRWWLWFFEWSLAASVFGVYTLVIELETHLCGSGAFALPQ